MSNYPSKTLTKDLPLCFFLFCCCSLVYKPELFSLGLGFCYLALGFCYFALGFCSGVLLLSPGVLLLCPGVLLPSPGVLLPICFPCIKCTYTFCESRLCKGHMLSVLSRWHYSGLGLTELCVTQKYQAAQLCLRVVKSS